jgi:hypothetical protein
VDAEAASQVLAGSAAAVAAAGKIWSDRRARGGARELIKRDLELLGLLPADSPVQPELREHVEHAIRRLIDDEQEKRRDPLGIGLAAFLLLSAALALRAGGYWIWLAAPTGLLGVIGMAQDAVPRRRDDRGRPLRGSADASLEPG